MQNYRQPLFRLSKFSNLSTLSRIPKPTTSFKPGLIHTPTTRKMSLFPRSFYAPDPSFAPLVRLLNDWDTYAREGQVSSSGGNNQRRHHGIQTFNPKFDVIEADNEYLLHGELGGIAKKDVHIEFTDEHTLVIKGRIEKSYSTGEPPESAGVIEAPASEQQGHEGNGDKVTARDEKEEAQTEGDEATQATKGQAQQKKPTYKYWLSERSVGEFSRVFQFPGRVERDGVTAGLENGILTVKVPKAKRAETRRIDIA